MIIHDYICRFFLYKIENSNHFIDGCDRLDLVFNRQLENEYDIKDFMKKCKLLVSKLRNHVNY